jgi:hypothetical protein
MLAAALLAHSNQTIAADNAPATNSVAPALEEPSERWSFSASAYTYFVPDDREYVQPTLTADRGWLHLEARYNYEALDTTSLWIGYNLSGGDKLAWEVTPMLGGAFGDADGVLPGYKGSLSWWKLELYSEGEWFIDVHDASDSFYYSWSELSLYPVDWLRFGLVAQRTRLYDTDREVARGLLAGVSLNHFDVTGYVFDPDDSKPVYVLAVAVNF